MTRQHDPEDPAQMDMWVREYYKIPSGEATDAYLIRKGISADTPTGFVSRMKMALAWLWPQLTPRTRPLYDEIFTIVDEYELKTSRVLTWVEGQPLPRRQEPSAVDTAKCEKALFLFEQAKELHRIDATLNAQAAFKQAQSARASKPRKLSEAQTQRIAKVYWDAKQEGGRRGVVKELAREFSVSVTRVQAIAKKFNPEKSDN